MKTKFICPACSQTLPATWYLSTHPTAIPIICNSCGRKLKLQKRAVAFGLLAMVPAIGISIVGIPRAMGLWNKEVTEPIFWGLMALTVAIYLPSSWLLYVNFCSWEIIGDHSSVSKPSQKIAPTRRRILTEGLTWGAQSAVLWSLAMSVIYKDSFLSHFGVAAITFPIGGLIWAALRIYNLGTAAK